MNSAIEQICAKVLQKITPSQKEKKRILQLADSIKRKVEQETVKAGFDATVRIEGSIAKDTWLTIDPDIDIFIQMPQETPREIFKTKILELAKKATKNAKHVERFAEHPYLEAILDSTRVNIVPCYKAKLGEWKSATDRTPYHTDYVKKHLSPELRNEVRLLKKFMKGISVYGAEIKVGGFSGYLCELLILHYRTFIKTLQAFANYKKKLIIDLENYYRNREREIELLFKEPLIIIDPIDQSRNVASAVRSQCLHMFIASSRVFLEKPSLKFFFPSETKIINKNEVTKIINNRGTTLVFIKFGEIKTVPDVLWGQLYKSQRSLRKMLEQYDFKVFKEAVFSNEKDLNIFIFEVESRYLAPTKKHDGPPLEKAAECENFLKTHLNSPNTVYGPFIDSGRWMVWVKRKYTDIVGLLQEKLKNGGRSIGVAESISETLRRNFEILVNQEILPVYFVEPEFSKFLVEYLIGKPKWLD
jgi:tRNA nucleotidyltransferase (CCA-adding enzyme)